MGTKRDQKFYERVWKRMRLYAKAKKSTDQDALLIEQIRHTREVLDPELLPNERELEGLCYGEYAYLTPMQRDELFARALNHAVKGGWPTHHFRGSGLPVELKYDWVHVPLDLEIPEVRSAIRKARQHYDALGLQYGTALMWIVRAHITYNGGHGLPRPNQFYSAMAMDTLREDDKYVREHFPAPFSSGAVDPRFLACNYVGHWGQVKALDAIEAYVRSETHWVHVFKRYWTEGLMSEAETRRRFGDDFADRLVAAYGPARYDWNGGAESPPATDHRACLGLSFDADSALCAGCSLRDRCIDITSRVQVAQVEAHGVEDPRTAFPRMDAAARQRNSRARRKPEHKSYRQAVGERIARILGYRYKPEASTRGRKSPEGPQS